MLPLVSLFQLQACNPVIIGFAVSTLVVLGLAYWILVPVSIVRVSATKRRNQSTVHFRSFETKDWSNRSRDKAPKAYPIPPVVPNGWIPIAESRDIQSNQIIKSHIHIHEVIIIRKPDGRIAVYDALCPHLGADLSVGGEVVTLRRGDGQESETCVKCPFHGWLFSVNNGRVTFVPYTKDQSKQRLHDYTIFRLLVCPLTKSTCDLCEQRVQKACG